MLSSIGTSTSNAYIFLVFFVYIKIQNYKIKLTYPPLLANHLGCSSTFGNLEITQAAGECIFQLFENLATYIHISFKKLYAPDTTFNVIYMVYAVLKILIEWKFNKEIFFVRVQHLQTELEMKMV